MAAPDELDLASLPRSLPALLARAAADPGRELVRFEDGVRVRVGELDERSRRLAARLAGPVGPGVAVATCLRPGPDALDAMFGLARRGAVEVPLAADVPVDAARSLCDRAGVRLGLVDADLVERRPDLVDVLRRRGPVLVPGESAPSGVRVPTVDPGPGDPLVVMSTSGTTGRSKAAVLPHFAAIRQAARVAAALDYDASDVLLNVFPWNHINARHAGVLPALLTGATLVVRRAFSASRFWDDCRAEGVTAFNFMGAMLAILERGPSGPRDRAHRVRRAYGAPVPADLAQRFAARFGVLALEAYACTELADVAVSTRRDRRPGTAGRVVPEYEVAVLDDAGRPVPVGGTGQIAVRARAGHLTFLGYAGDPAATASVLVDGWFRTGDRGRLDEHGHLVFAGRRADVVRRRGENVATWDVEQAVRTMPGVQDVAVLGVASELTEQEVLAVVEPVPGACVPAAAVRDWCGARLPRHAVPRYVRIVAGLPRTPTGKVAKAELATAGVAPGTWDADAS